MIHFILVKSVVTNYSISFYPLKHAFYKTKCFNGDPRIAWF